MDVKKKKTNKERVKSQKNLCINYIVLQNMDTSINERLNTMNQSVEAKKKKKYNAI